MIKYMEQEGALKPRRRLYLCVLERVSMELYQKWHYEVNSMDIGIKKRKKSEETIVKNRQKWYNMKHKEAMQ